MAIKIKPENKGKFTAYKKRTGKTTEEALHSSDPHVRKMANFAKNAKKWHKGEEGLQVLFEEGPSKKAKKKMNKEILNNYGIYNGIVDENGKFIDNPSEIETIKTMINYMKHNNPDSNIYRSPFQHHSITPQPILPIAEHGGSISSKKAKEILHDGTAHGKKLTTKQRKFFGAMSNKAQTGLNVGPGPQFPTADPNMLWTTAKALGDPNVTAPVDPNRLVFPNTNNVATNAPAGGYLNNNMTPVTSNQPSSGKLPMPNVSPVSSEGMAPNRTQAQNLNPAVPQGPASQKKKKNMDFGNALGGKTGFDSLPGQIAGASLQILNNVIQERDRPKNLYIRPEDLPTYNPHPYGVLNSQGQGSQAISRKGKTITPKKAFWGALIGAAGGVGGGAAAAAGSAATAGATAGVAAGTTGAATAGTSALGAASTATQAAGQAKGLKGHWEKPFRQTAEAIKGTLQDAMDFTKMISIMRDTGVDPANVQQPNYARMEQINQNNLNQMYKMDHGGNISMNDNSGLITYEGGHAPKESFNMFDGGTHMFKGDSHENGGIKSAFMGVPFEAEGGEPFAILDNKGVVFGKLTNPITGRQYKTDATAIMKKEKKVSKYLDLGLELVHSKNPYDPYERLAFNSGVAMMKGATSKQAELTASKKHLAEMQKAHLDLMGEKSEISRYGNTIADEGIEVGPEDIKPHPGDKKVKWNKSKYSQAEWEALATKLGYDYKKGNNKDFQRFIWNSKYGDIAKQMHKQYGMPRAGRYDDGYLGRRWDAVYEAINKDLTGYGERLPMPNVERYSPTPNYKHSTIKDIVTSPSNLPAESYKFTPVEPYSPSKLKNPLSPLQFMGEAAGLLDRPDAVKAQLYQPDLFTPYQVSFQDRINEQNATFNAIQKSLTDNPTALATLAANKYTANDSVKGEEFRVNQGIANDIMNKNVNLLNDAKLKNLGIIDTQYVRQNQAKSITKQNRINALNSISAKILQNKAETNELNTYRNLFPHYGFNKDYQVVKEGPGGQEYLNWNSINPGANSNKTTISYDAKGNKKGSKVTIDTPEKQRLEEIQLFQAERKNAGLPATIVPLKKNFGKNGLIIKKYREKY